MTDDRELRGAAFETILFNPGISFDDWRIKLLREYTSEVVEALGSNPEDVTEGLEQLWDSPYTDSSTEITKTYREWTALLKDQRMVDYYYSLIHSQEE